MTHWNRGTYGIRQRHLGETVFSSHGGFGPRYGTIQYLQWIYAIFAWICTKNRGIDRRYCHYGNSRNSHGTG